MRFRTLALGLSPVLIAGIPIVAHAATIPFFGPIIPSSAATCAGNFGLLLTVVNNIISLLITLGIVFVAPLSIGYAGFLMVVNPTSIGDIQKAKGIILNTIVGIVIALAAWLIVGAVMNVLYKGSLPSWDSIIRGDAGNFCIQLEGSLSQAQTAPTQRNGSGAPDGAFSYQSGIQAQYNDASPALQSLLSCMANIVPGDVGNISSISDHYITDATYTFDQCASGSASCSHTAHSCHYGGRTCVGKSYAVDFGDEQHSDVLKAAATQCSNGAARFNFEGNHLHVSIGASSGCGCDTGLSSS